MSEEKLQIDPTKKFEHLPRAPIVEAVIHWRARVGKKFPTDELVQALKGELPDYPTAQAQHEIELMTQIGPEGVSSQVHHATSHGFRFVSSDGKQIAQFTRNGFVFSRLQPYENWEQFEAEARRLWGIYRRLVEPAEVERLGVRFINRIAPVKLTEIAGLLQFPPKSPVGLKAPMRGFMHQTTFTIPGHAYNLNVIQTVQPPASAENDTYGLILDLDVFTTQPVDMEQTRLTERLKEMRWLKNMAFFTFLKKKAIQRFKG